MEDFQKKCEDISFGIDIEMVGLDKMIESANRTVYLLNELEKELEKLNNMKLELNYDVSDE